MESLNDLGLENWHDFEVSSRREIVALLRGIGENNQMIRMLVHGEADVCMSSILEVDPDTDSVILDRAIDTGQNRRIVAAARIGFETTLDKIRIMFTASKVETATFEGRPAFRIAIPRTLVRLQRREFYRMATPVGNPVRVIVQMPPQLGGGSNSFPLADISCGGIAILDNKMLLGDAVGLKLVDCRIDLPDIGMVASSLQVRNSLDLTLLNNKTNHRLGCEFFDISRANAANVQRYITRLERERNARVAGTS